MQCQIFLLYYYTIFIFSYLIMYNSIGFIYCFIAYTVMYLRSTLHN